MKKQILLSLFTLFIYIGAQAQKEAPLPNTDFEDWTLDESTGDFEPDNYVTVDQLIASFFAPGISDQVKRGSLLDVHSGTYSAILKTDTVNVPQFGTIPLTGVMFLASGVEQFQTGLGLDYAYKPLQIKGWYKYTPFGDTCNIVAIASKYDEDAGERVDLGVGFFASSDTVPNFTEFTINMDYDPQYNLIPDTLSFIIASSPLGGGGINQNAKAGAKLVVDDFSVKLGTACDFTNSPAKTIRVGDSVSFNLLTSGNYDKIKWTFPDTVITDVEKPKITFKTKGSNLVKLELLDAKDSIVATNSKTLNVQSGVGIQREITKSENVTLAPNPAAYSSILSYNLDKSANVTIKIADVTGKVVRTYNEGTKAGLNKFIISTNDLPNGLYFVNMTNGEKTITKKLTVNK